MLIAIIFVDLLNAFQVSVIKGNAAEIGYLAGSSDASGYLRTITRPAKLVDRLYPEASMQLAISPTQLQPFVH